MVTAEQVRELRERTGAGLMDCKKALGQTNSDIEKAIDYLRKEGILKAAKKSARTTKEGLIMESHSPDGQVAALVEVNCETDFVARTDDFKNFCSVLVEQILRGQPSDLETLKKEKLGHNTVETVLNELVTRIGENLSISRFEVFKAKGDSPKDREKVGVYVHPGNKIGVLVQMEGDPSKLTGSLVKDLAMHVAAMHPLYLSGEEVPADVAAREKANLKESPDLASKPANMIEKIVLGKYTKFLSEVCLLDQVFIRDLTGKGTVRETIAKVDPSLRIVRFARYQVGENK
ncbi:MAG: translation elongation factor Ts [Deltaproteobacteria bacterium]|nr:translation elongation factor Ts [Deltaproteobacteria bacterium]